jgi:O-antigen/teichoic acid export membrane protein
MSIKISKIARNTSHFTLALILQKIISFTYFIIIARALGPEDLGKYYFAIAFTTIFAIFTDVGLSNVLTREVAKTEEKAKELLGNILSIKIFLIFFSSLAVIILVNLLGYGELTKQLVYLAAICMVLDSFTATFFAVSRGFHNLFFESVGSVFFQLIVLSSGVLILKLGYGLRWLISALVLASIFYFLYSAVLLWTKWKIALMPKFSKGLIKLIISITIPFSLFAVFQRVYTYLDSVLLSSLAGDKYVGIYQVAFKIIFALQFLPMAFIASLYPALSAYWMKNREQLGITFERAMNYLIIISLPIAAGIIVIADKAVFLFKSGFGESVLPLKISMLALPFIFLMFPVGALLNACDRQKTNTYIMGAGLALSVIMNLILIPRFQAVGASITVLTTNAFMFFAAFSTVSSITPYKMKKILKTLFKSLAAVVIMAVSVFYLKSFINIFIVAGIGGALYFAILFVLGGFRREDVASIFRSFRGNKNLEISN